MAHVRILVDTFRRACFRCGAGTFDTMTYKSIITFLVLCLVRTSADAACIFGRGGAGHNPAYHYAVAYINSITAADTGLRRMSKVGKELKPADNYQSALVGFTEALKEYELAARDLECAASIIQAQEQFPSAGPGMLAEKQMDAARKTASTTRFL